MKCHDVVFYLRETKAIKYSMVGVSQGAKKNYTDCRMNIEDQRSGVSKIRSHHIQNISQYIITVIKQKHKYQHQLNNDTALKTQHRFMHTQFIIFRRGSDEAACTGVHE